MKVCTDACLFGAWVAATIERDISLKNILDIGTGTGLLSLMLAQKNEAYIDAVEINTAAAIQASENFKVSPWKDRLQVLQTGIDEFDPSKKYDCIISNPPFFEDDLKSGNTSKNAAKHDTTLTLDDLVTQVNRLLQADGVGCILIPFHRTAYAEELVKKNGFFVNQKMLVRQSVHHGYFRTMMLFSRHSTETITEELFIHDEQRNYGEDFAKLLRDYYLKL